MEYRGECMYVIKQFGLLNKEEQLGVLECFKKEGQDLIIQHYGISTISDDDIFNDDIRSQIEDYYEAYCMDIIYYYDEKLKFKIDEKIKNILWEAQKESNVDKSEKLKSKLLDDLKAGNVLNLNNTVLYNIKKLVYLEIHNNNYDRKVEEFISKRKVFSNNTVIFEDGKHSTEAEIVWYKPQNRAEYLYALNLEGIYTCIVLSPNESFEKFSYALVYNETEVNYDLIIFKGMSKP